MDDSLRFHRRLAVWLAPLLCALLVGVVLVGSIHHHGALDSHHPCAVCTAAHAPAIAATAAPTFGACSALARIERAPDFEPRARAAIRGIASRAPPSA